MIRFIAIVLTAFFARVKPVSSIAKPACMNITRKPPTSTQARFTEFSSGGVDAAVCARASNGNAKQRQRNENRGDQSGL